MMDVPVAVVGVVAAVPATYLAVLSLAALRPEDSGTATLGPETAPRLAVLVPAHDEAQLIGRCLGTLALQDYPATRFDVYVIADNCSDDTAAIAERFGVEPLERNDPSAPGKGRALRWAIQRLLESDSSIDAFVVVDADSVTEPDLLSALASAYLRGADVVQADYGALVEAEDARSQLRAAAFLLFHRVRFSGKARLGLPCGLVGNGMLFSREVVRRHPWSAFSEVEDLEYGLQLRLGGIAPAFARGAVLRAPVASSGRAAEVQRTRWEGGRLRVTRQYLPRLVKEMSLYRRLSLWDAVLDLSVPPLGVLTVGTAAGAAVAVGFRVTGLVGTRALVPWALATGALPVHVLVGLRAGGAPTSMVRSLVGAPRLVIDELATRLGVLLDDSPPAWVRTPRPTSVPPPVPGTLSAGSERPCVDRRNTTSETGRG